ncbi:Hypothetical predicted protein [Cloeon dipterum]|uniref:Uncharacterized protein n=1 Tax=Cloeon dipterum TaxID=197152 RepID=A0A8S1DEJ5_9INSE|nr:Hypothetical predicted protein [Cloeon dipterum]
MGRERGGGGGGGGVLAAAGSQDEERESSDELDRNDLFSLSTSREWNLLSELCEPVDLGGDELVDDEPLLGDCRLARDECDVRTAIGADRWAGLKKSVEPGDVDRLGHSLLRLSDTLRLLSELRRLPLGRWDL